jgi:glutathione S-transferase
MGDLILTTFEWVPEMSRGYVRDLRVRWALEEGCSRNRRANRGLG